MKLVYCAGRFSAPTRAEVEANIAQAVDVALEVARAGFMPVCPHANTAHPDFEQVQPYRFWIEGTRELLKRCDAMVLVPCFEGSAGTLGEIETAHEMGIPIFHSVAELAAAAPPNARVVVPQEISKEDRP
jgi:hypothetical protein